MTKSRLTINSEDYVFSVAGARYVALRLQPVRPSTHLITAVVFSHLIQDFVFPGAHSFTLATVFRLPEADKVHITAEWLKERVASYQQDDVFHTSFLANIVFHGAERDDLEITDDAVKYLREIGNQATACTTVAGLLTGPYACINQQLREAWKLVDDFNGTCMVTLKPQSGSDDQFSCFALPSRISAQATTSSALAGFRIIIKDNIHLKGIKTSVGNQSFWNTYPACDESAKCIEKLINGGVVISGKAKMNSFGNWEEPTEYTDYQAPWNPRADRYQSTGGSSSGSAAAIASYDWLDIAIGTDSE
ncbi:hypothetical protein ACHAP5_009201 [Fusarium lateritium]